MAAGQPRFGLVTAHFDSAAIRFGVEMSLRDRFFTPSTARAILSWRLAAGAGVVVALGLAGLGWGLATLAGVAVYGVLVATAMPKTQRSVAVDPFSISEPWRQLVQQAQSSVRKLKQTVAGTADGPLRQRLETITDDVDRGLGQAWAVARRGDEIDAAVRRLDPTALRSRLATLQRQQDTTPSSDLTAAIVSVEAQLATADRLKAQSAATAHSLQLTQVKLDELVAHANEVVVGSVTPDDYASQVDDLVVALEALNQAVHEVDSTTEQIGTDGATDGQS